MGLLEQQNLMARLYTDEAVRRNFLADPHRVLRDLGLSDDEAVELAGVLPEELNFFAGSLFRKRLREIERMLPLTTRSLGDKFEVEFQRYNEAILESREKSRADDALEFCRYIERTYTGETAEASRFERLKRQFFAGKKNFVLAKFEGRRFIWLRLAGHTIQRSF